MQGGLSTIAQLSSGASDVLHPYIIITLEYKVNRVILHSLIHMKNGSPAAAIHGGPQRSTVAYSGTQAQGRLANSRQRMLTAASCPTRIDVVGRRHRAERDPDV
jgi:hypothetical protein